MRKTQSHYSRGLPLCRVCAFRLNENGLFMTIWVWSMCAPLLLLRLLLILPVLYCRCISSLTNLFMLCVCVCECAFFNYVRASFALILTLIYMFCCWYFLLSFLCVYGAFAFCLIVIYYLSFVPLLRWKNGHTRYFGVCVVFSLTLNMCVCITRL